MRVERPNTERPGQFDLSTACDNPACEREKYVGYTAPWMMLATSFSFEWDGWLTVMGVDACSWACLSVAAANKAAEVPA